MVAASQMVKMASMPLPRLTLLAIALSVAGGLLLERVPHGSAASKNIAQAPEAAREGAGNSRRPRWKRAIATVFWVGETETSDNDYIANLKSAWDRNWVQNFGGTDHPEERCGYAPCAFKPKENPFYVALPYDDMQENGHRKRDNSVVPWDKPGAQQSLLKNRWVAIRANDQTCYAQWQDVGPFENDDADYVFGAAPKPKNVKGVRAGIDLSPAVRDCLKLGGVSEVYWRHVEWSEVPSGPWKRTITRRRGP
jgi:hypothetical protein